MAAPFMELELGRPITMEDYQTSLDHIQKGSVDFLKDQTTDKILDSALKPSVADADLRERFLFVGVPRWRY